MVSSEHHAVSSLRCRLKYAITCDVVFSIAPLVVADELGGGVSDDPFKMAWTAKKS